MQLTTSSGSSALRCMTSRTSSSVPARIASASLSATVVAPRRACSRIALILSVAPGAPQPGDLGVAEAAHAADGQVAERAAAAGGMETSVTGGSNADVAGAADLVIVAVPFGGHAATLAELATPLAGKVVVDCVVPMGFDELGAYVLDVEEGSVAQQAAALLPDSSVVGAFHHLSAVLLEDLSRPTLDGDVMVVGVDRSAPDLV